MCLWGTFRIQTIASCQQEMLSYLVVQWFLHKLVQSHHRQILFSFYVSFVFLLTVTKSICCTGPLTNTHVCVLPSRWMSRQIWTCLLSWDLHPELLSHPSPLSHPFCSLHLRAAVFLPPMRSAPFHTLGLTAALETSMHAASYYWWRAPR